MSTSKIFGNFPRLFSILSYSERYLILSLLLSLFGVLVVYSASAAFRRYGFEGDSFFLIRQSSFLGVGSVLMFIASKTPTRVLRRYSWVLLVLSFVLMAVVLIPGIGDLKYGARRWLRFFGIGLQPSELLKFTVVLWMADFMQRKQDKLSEFRTGILPVLTMLGVVATFLILQPDFGTIILLGALLLLMGFYGGMALRHLTIVSIIIGSFGVVMVAVSINRLSRLLSYLDPWVDPTDSGFQLVNSLIAFGSGGLWGQGIGNSLQKQYYLPLAHTDFVFATIGEELGLVGVGLLLAAFFLLFRFGYKVAVFCQDDFGRYLTFGCVSLLVLQSLMHFGVVMGLLPTKGIGLPYISYGGSSLVMFLTMCGVIYRCGIENKT